LIEPRIRLAGPPPAVRFEYRGATPAQLCLLSVALAWLGNALYALGAPGGALKTWSPALVAAAMIGFVLIHGRHSGGWRSVLLFMLAVLPVAWAAETLSIHTGIPFGLYHYADSMGPFLGDVPLVVPPAYLVMAYVSWSMARILLRRLGWSHDRELLARGPWVAAALMVIWDLSMDPLRATVEQRWVWLDGGVHHGVPLSNYLGWFAVTWTMFRLYAWLLTRIGTSAPTPEVQASAPFWYSAPLMYLAFAVEYIGNPLMFGGHDATLTAHGVSLALDEIHREVALLAAATMVPVSLLTAAGVRRAWSDAFGARAGPP
jgi:putative membrane protein